MKKITKICSVLLSFVLLCGVSACGNDSSGENKPNPNPNPDKPNPEKPVPEEISYNSYTANRELEKDFVYMWNEKPLQSSNIPEKAWGTNVRFQTEQYAMQMNGGTGKITKMGNYRSLKDGKYTQCDFSKLPEIRTDFSIDVADKQYKSIEKNELPQMVSSGRYLQMINQGIIRYEGLNGVQSRMEIAAVKDHLALIHEVYSEEGKKADLRFTLTFQGYQSQNAFGGRGLFINDGNGNGFVFLKSIDNAPELLFKDGVLTVQRKGLNLPPLTYDGFSVLVFVIESNDFSAVDALLQLEKAELAVLATSPQSNAATLYYDSKYGVLRLNTNNLRIPDQSTEKGRQTYEKIEFSIKNIKGNSKISPTVIIDKNNMSTGMSYVLRDRKSHIPTGEPVQVSKDWHSRTKMEFYETLYAGGWIKSAMHFDIQPEETLERELVLVCGMWGKTYAASHSQLSLVGYSKRCEIWDESAMGAWGESVTYDPNIGLNRSTIDDVRPFLNESHRKGKEGKWRWTGNVGGANFFHYVDKNGDRHRLADQKIFYQTQGPCLTHVNYSGITDDRKIAADITINMGRTNDIVRNYYTLKFTFLDDVDFERLSFFQLAADGYSDNKYTEYAVGDETGVLKTGDNKVEPGPLSPNYTAENDGFWFALLNSADRYEETSDVMFTVREYKAVLNGTTHTKPSYRFFGTKNGTPQNSCELVVPQGIKTVEKGSVVEVKVEYDVLPNVWKDYYGDSEYILQSGEIYGTTEAAMQQVVYGKQMVNVTRGTLVGNYPLTIAMNQGDEDIYFNLIGGLGYVPVKFVGLDSGNYILQKKTDGFYQDLDQAVHGNDFWQTYYNATTGKYEMAFNVPNCVGMDYLAENEYRLVKMF